MDSDADSDADSESESSPKTKRAKRVEGAHAGMAVKEPAAPENIESLEERAMRLLQGRN
jgi:hypothetical protein